MDENREYGWDERIEGKGADDGSFTIFPDGIYPFTVIDFERSRYEGSEKLPACNMAIVKMQFEGGPQLGKTTVQHRIFLHTKTKGLIAQFFRGLNLRKHDDDIALGDFSRIKGCRGFARLGKRTFDGKEYQDIKRFIEPEEWPQQAPQPVQQPQNPNVDTPF
jgi:hypothetical protein